MVHSFVLFGGKTSANLKQAGCCEQRAKCTASFTFVFQWLIVPFLTSGFPLIGLPRSLPPAAAVSQVGSPSLSPGRRRPPLAPGDDVATPGDSSPELSLPPSPQLKSTARDQHR